jgi:hypothetical protein
MKKKKTFLYTLKDKDKVPIIQCFNYKEAKARQFYHELEYGEKLTLHRVEY